MLTALPPRARRAGDTICDELIDEAVRDTEEGEGVCALWRPQWTAAATRT